MVAKQKVKLQVVVVCVYSIHTLLGCCCQVWLSWRLLWSRQSRPGRESPALQVHLC